MCYRLLKLVKSRRFFSSDHTQKRYMTDADIYELWEERAAIIEFDGNRDRANAEKLAAIRIRKQFGRVPQQILDAVNPEPEKE